MRYRPGPECKNILFSLIGLLPTLGLLAMLLVGHGCDGNPDYDPQDIYGVDDKRFDQPRPKAEILTTGKPESHRRPVVEKAGGEDKLPALPAPDLAGLEPATRIANPDQGMLRGDAFDRKVTFNFRDAEIRDILRVIGETYRLNILGVNLVDKRITVSLHDVKLRDAFDTILRTNGFRYKVIGKIVVVTGRSNNVVAKVFNLTHVKPKDVEPILKSFITASKIDGSISILESPSRLVVTASPEAMPTIETLVHQLDARPRQVLIEASIIAIDTSSLSNLGITVGGPGEEPASGLSTAPQDFYTKTKDDFTRILTGNIAFPGTSSQLSGGQLTFGASLDRYAFDAKIDALASEGKAKVLSQPRIGVISEHTAKIVVGQEVLYNLETTVSGSGNVVESSQFREAGIQLEVTPTVGDDGFVTIQVRPEVSSFVGDITALDSPPISTTKAETTVCVKDRHTAVIAGLVSRTDSANNQGVPGLRRVPILNFFLSSRSRTWQQREIIVLITPHIIRDGTAWPTRGVKLANPRNIPWKRK